MPKKSIVYIYGALGSREVTGVKIGDLLMEDKTIKGLYLTNVFDAYSF